MKFPPTIWRVTVLIATTISLIMMEGRVSGSEIKTLKSGVVKQRKSIVKQRKNAENIDKKLRYKKRQVKNIRETKRQIIWKLDLLERKIASEERSLENLNTSLKKTQNEIETTQKEINELTTRTQLTKDYLSRRLEAYYKSSQSLPLNSLFSAKTFTDSLRNTRYIKAMISYDTTLLMNYRTSVDSFHLKQRRLTFEKEKLRNLRSEIEQRQRTINRERNKKIALLREVKNKESLYLAAIRDLDEASEVLQDTIRRLEKEEKETRHRRDLRKRVGVKGFASLKGKLPPPVSGKVVEFYGKEKHPRFNTFIFHKGIRIEAPHGSKIRSVYGGRVTYSDWFKGYGNIIIIDHGDNYYSLSCHASQLLKKVGETVSQGEVIAMVGDTGSFHETGLYFEIRHGIKSVNPLDWLTKSGLTIARR